MTPLAQLCLGPVQEADGAYGISDGVSSLAQEDQGLNVVGARASLREQRVNDLAARDGLGDGQGGDIAGIGGHPGDLPGHRGHHLTRVGSGVSPIAAQRRGEEQVQRHVRLPGVHGPSRQAAHFHDPAAVAGDSVVKRLAQDLDPGLVELGEQAVSASPPPAAARLPQDARD